MKPNDAQIRAQSELQSAKVSTGPAPLTRVVRPSPLSPRIFRHPFAGFALFWISQAYHATSSMSKSTNTPSPMAFRFPDIRLAFSLGRTRHSPRPTLAFLKGGSTVYAITNQRIYDHTAHTAW